MTASVCAVSNVGTVRDENQDVVVVGSLVSSGTMKRPIQVRFGADEGLVAVVDGMGGHAGGRTAAEIVAHGVAAGGDYGLQSQHLDGLVQRANTELHRRMSVEPELLGMGATLAGVTWDVDLAIVFHIGDSRVYGCTASEVRRLTNDHRASEGGNTLTRSIGGTATLQDVELTSTELQLHEPTRFLCCTDGLSDVVDFDTIERHLVEDELAACTEGLLSEALGRGADDNVSLVVIDLEPVSAGVSPVDAVEPGTPVTNDRPPGSDAQERPNRRGLANWLKGTEG